MNPFLIKRNIVDRADAAGEQLNPPTYGTLKRALRDFPYSEDVVNLTYRKMEMDVNNELIIPYQRDYMWNIPALMDLFRQFEIRQISDLLADRSSDLDDAYGITPGGLKTVATHLLQEFEQMRPVLERWASYKR